MCTASLTEPGVWFLRETHAGEMGNFRALFTAQHLTTITAKLAQFIVPVVSLRGIATFFAGPTKPSLGRFIEFIPEAS